MKRGPVNSTLSRGYGTLAGLGITGAAIFAVPSTLLLEPLPPAEAYLVTVAGVVTGLACMALPWERLNPRWLHLVGALATVEAAAAVAVFGHVYAAFFFLIAVAVAYVTPDARSLLPHLGVIGVALLAPLAFGPATAKETLQMALVVFPLLCLTAGLFAYLRQRMVADRSSYRVFAEETLSLATRIAGRPLPGSRPVSDASDIPGWSRHVRVSSRVAGAAAAILALPLVSAGLAVAGVRLPVFAAETLRSVGIELPNQDEEAHRESEAMAKDALPGLDPGATPPDVGAAQPRRPDARSGREEGDPGSADAVKSGSRAAGPLSGGSAGPAGPIAGTPPGSEPRPPASAAQQPTQDRGGPSSDGTVAQALEEAMSGIGGIIEGQRRSDPEAESPPEEDSKRIGYRFPGSGDEVDQGAGQNTEEDGGEGCDESAADDDPAADPEAAPCAVDVP